MSNAGGVNSLPTFQPSQFNEASNVLGKIETQIGNVQNIFASVQQLLAEMAALSPPNINAFKDSKGNVNTTAYNAAMVDYQKKVAALNVKLEDTYRKLGQAQAILQRLQGTELPAAERRDAEKLAEDFKRAVEALDSAVQSCSEMSTSEELGQTSSQAETRIEVRVQQRNLEIKLDSDPSFSQVIQAFALLAFIVGQSQPEQRYTSVPPPAGGGLPPIGTP